MHVKPEAERTAGAPALEKGLDLIEALAEEPEGLTQKAVADRVGRSVNEIFRMLGVLERRGYVARDARGHYALTLRLFELAHRHPPERRLLEASLQAMEELSATVGHACHLVVMHAKHLLVLAQEQPDSVLMGWSVRLGAAFPMAEKYASARVIAAFQRPERQAELVAIMAAQEGASPPAAIKAKLDAIAAAGYDYAPSGIAFGVTDVSCPVLNHFGQAIAALTVPYMSQPDVEVSKEELVDAVRAAARVISVAMGAPRTDQGEGSNGE
jgi:DNA-binding IclR family transcriptional regulator